MNNELKHYGVLGMRWGVRKDGKSYISTYSANKKAKLAAMKSRVRDYESSINGNKVSVAKSNANARKARQQSLESSRAYNKQLREARKMMAMERREAIKKYRKEINAGASFMDKVVNRLTGADLLEADLRYETERRNK